MHSSLPHYVLGFHGFDQAVAEAVVGKQQNLKPSENDYDWLGHGIYFWENDPARALRYAKEIQKNQQRTPGNIQRPAVIGAIITLGLCLNLIEADPLGLLTDGYDLLQASLEAEGKALPENKPFKKDEAPLSAETGLCRDRNSASVLRGSIPGPFRFG